MLLLYNFSAKHYVQGCLSVLNFDQYATAKYFPVKMQPPVQLI